MSLVRSIQPQQKQHWRSRGKQYNQPEVYGWGRPVPDGHLTYHQCPATGHIHPWRALSRSQACFFHTEEALQNGITPDTEYEDWILYINCILCLQCSSGCSSAGVVEPEDPQQRSSLEAAGSSVSLQIWTLDKQIHTSSQQYVPANIFHRKHLLIKLFLRMSYILFLSIYTFLQELMWEYMKLGWQYGQ